METAKVLKQLESLGSAQTRKTYGRHGVEGAMYGVSYADLGKLKKTIKVDHELARGLWASGNHDARILAAMVADPAAATPKELESWAKDLRNYALADALAGLASASPHAPKLMAKWLRSSNEWIAASGWNVLARRAASDPSLTDDELVSALKTIEAEIHQSQNRVRYAMNGALIAIGCRNPRLQKLAVAAAKRIGQVEVDHGDTDCKTPDAAAYIAKVVARQSAKARPKKG